MLRATHDWWLELMDGRARRRVERDGDMHGVISLRSDGSRRVYGLDAGDQKVELWFELEGAPVGPPTLDSALIASALAWSRRGVTDVHLDGPVSAQLLRNVDELQLLWAKWRPERYRPVRYHAEEVVDRPVSGEGAVVAFSGGVDATFTLLRHLDGPAWDVPVREAVMVHGFDILHDRDAEVFRSAAERSRRLLDEVGVPLRTVRTNFRDIGIKWIDAFGCGLAGVLHLWDGRRRVGYVGSAEDYGDVVRHFRPWGSTPVQDWMGSNDLLEIRHDGAGFSRSEKIRRISTSATALDSLRVCWQGAALDRNCGRCEKCRRTALNFRAVGIPVPESLPADPRPFDVLRTPLRNRGAVTEYRSILEASRASGCTGAWVTALRLTVLRGRTKFALRAAASSLIPASTST